MTNDYERLDFISQKYRGIRKVDLCPMNTMYSCIICKKFAICGRIGGACPEHKPMSEEEFAQQYDFKEIVNE